MDSYLTLGLLFYVSFADQHKLFTEKKKKYDIYTRQLNDGEEVAENKDSFLEDKM